MRGGGSKSQLLLKVLGIDKSRLEELFVKSVTALCSKLMIDTDFFVKFATPIKAGGM